MPITSRFFYALGFHVPDNNIVYFEPDQLELGADVDAAGKNGKPRKMTPARLFDDSAQSPHAARWRTVRRLP